MDRVSATIDLCKLQKNLEKITNSVADQVKIMAVVKADAYGHGAVSISKKLIESYPALGYLGVASVTEALNLRAAKITLPILILTECSLDQISRLITDDLTQTIYNKEFAFRLNELAKKQNKKIKIHLKIDTGMNRVGVPVNKLEVFLLFLKELDCLELEGVFTHLACADEKENNYTLEQLKLFDTAVVLAKKYFLAIEYVHAANSAAVFNYPQSHYNLVRPGIAFYRGIMKFNSIVNNVKIVPAQTAIGYGSTQITSAQTKIATIAVGYADGYSRLLSGKSRVLIKGSSYPLIGTVCMDMLMVNVFDDNINIGDEVTLIGVDGKEEITAAEIAALTKTIDYEVYCGIGKRVERYYIN